MNICTCISCQNTELAIYLSVAVLAVFGLMPLLESAPNRWMNSAGTKPTAMILRTTFPEKGLSFFVILKMKILLTVTVENFLHWTLNTDYH